MPRRNPHDPAYGEDVLSLSEAAHGLGIHPQTYKKGVRLGKLPGIVFGQTYLIPRKWYERMLNGDWRPPAQNEQETESK
jgi:hypothetical protein